MEHSTYRYFKGPAWALLFIAAILLKSCALSAPDPDKEEWIELFNGSDMKEWTPKFTGFELGENYKNRFLVKDSLLSVRYAEKDTFNGDFGHLYYNQKFSHYRLKAVYRFVGQQMNGGPGWAVPVSYTHLTLPTILRV